MNIKFIQDFRGRETNEQYFEAGEVVELPDGVAQKLIDDGRAAAIEPAGVEITPLDSVLPSEEAPKVEPEVEQPVEVPEPKPNKRSRKNNAG